MDNNPYEPPKMDVQTEMRLARKRRKMINSLLTVGLFIALFGAYWGIRILFWYLNEWLLDR